MTLDTTLLPGGAAAAITVTLNVQSIFGEKRVTENALALCVRACPGPKTAHSFREQAL